MAETLPQLVVLKAVSDGRYAYYLDETGSYCGNVGVGDVSVFDPLAQIEIERAQDARYYNKYVHLRFPHTNKYWASKFDNMVFATSDQPQEDTSNPSCTLFHPKIIDKNLYLIHVQSKRAVRTPRGLHLDNQNDGNGSLGEEHAFNLVNCDELVKLPKFVAFKGDNGKYLKSVWLEGHPYLEFSSDDPNQNETAHEVQLLKHGHVCLKSVYFGNFWRRSPNWIWGDSSCENGKETWFWPVRLSDGKIALRSAGNDNFCKRLTDEGKTSCLNACAPTTAIEARLQMEELVDETNIYNLRLRMDHARVFDEKPYVAGTVTAINDRDKGEMNVGVKLGHAVANSYSFSKSLAISTSFKASIQTDIKLVPKAAVKTTLELSVSVTGTLTWGHIMTETKTIEANGSVPVPARSKAIVHCVGTRGRYSIPFSYTQKDKRSTDGKSEVTEHSDGIFTGVTCYNFTFQVMKTEPL
ncbi:hypothetical protein C2S52_019231 [Perilla frutescens var. hirtella]|nr:hypothetical protein C2S52_019231 [Perilla frutescens var. hirtella]